MLINVGVSAVDGVSEYDCLVPTKESALAFLEQFDHAGSVIGLQIIEDDKQTILDVMENPDEIYNYLKGRI